MSDETRALISRLSGHDRRADEEIIRDLIAHHGQGLVEHARRELLESHWPHCMALAMLLARIGGADARAALVDGLKAKRHHIRTAAIEGLVAMGNEDAAAALERMLGDPAYETRMAAKEGIRRLTGREVLTAKGE